MMKNPTITPFGHLAGDSSISPVCPGSPYIVSSETGKAVKEALRHLPEIHPALRLFQYALMPDHLHIILSVEKGLDETLGRKIAIFKTMVNKFSNRDHVFEKGFNDQILKRERNLNAIFDYLRQNPYRLAVRKSNPLFFQRKEDILIGDTPCQAYGNLQLLTNPFMEQVIVHRADSLETFNNKKDRWLHTAANGGVLVSPFISPRENAVRKEAINLGGRFILNRHQPFADREKPHKEDFELCARGRMLIISSSRGVLFNRAACLTMNALASAIATKTQPNPFLR